jgi:hypothetical protein
MRIELDVGKKRREEDRIGGDKDEERRKGRPFL